MSVLIDNYDSFTYILGQMLATIGADAVAGIALCEDFQRAGVRRKGA